MSSRSLTEIKKIKQLLYQNIVDSLNTKIANAIIELDSLKNSRNNESKSSAGDKHETARAMIQQEIDQQEMQLHNFMNLKSEVANININREYKKVTTGCIVTTNHENYFFSIGLGKIILNTENYYALSIASPVGKLLENKTTGEKIILNGRELLISGIY